MITDHHKNHLYSELNDCLDSLVKIYRHILDVVRKEKDYLVTADMAELAESNRAKEAMLLKVREFETQRVKLVRKMAAELEIEGSSPSLKELAIYFGGDRGDKLRNIQNVLDLLLKRVAEHNRQNDELVQSALRNVQGAMDSIKKTVSAEDKGTYQRKGELQSIGTGSGRFVSREV